MKLIIDIPEETYEYIKIASDSGWLTSPEYANAIGLTSSEYAHAIVNGTPLDSAEIEKKCDRINSIASVLSYSQHREIQELLCEILTSIDNAESEDKE